MTKEDIKVGTYLKRKGCREYYRIVSDLCFPWGNAYAACIVIEQVFTPMPCMNTISKEMLIEEMEVYHGEDFFDYCIDRRLHTKYVAQSD